MGLPLRWIKIMTAAGESCACSPQVTVTVNSLLNWVFTWRLWLAWAPDIKSCLTWKSRLHFAIQYLDDQVLLHVCELVVIGYVIALGILYCLKACLRILLHCSVKIQLVWMETELLYIEPDLNKAEMWQGCYKTGNGKPSGLCVNTLA